MDYASGPDRPEPITWQQEHELKDLRQQVVKLRAELENVYAAHESVSRQLHAVQTQLAKLTIERDQLAGFKVEASRILDEVDNLKERLRAIKQ